MINLCANLTGSHTGCPDIWLNIILSKFVRVFLDEINIWIGRVNKTDCLSPCSRPHLIYLKTCIEQKGWIRMNLLSFLTVFELGYRSSLPLDSVWTWTSLILLAFLLLQLADCRSWDFSVFIIVWTNSLK